MSEAKARELLQNALDHIVTLRETIETIHKLYPKLTVAICGATFDEEAARAYLAAVPAPPAEPRVPREPTAWMVTRDYHHEHPSFGRAEFFTSEEAATDNACLGTVDAHVTPLYAAPAAVEPREIGERHPYCGTKEECWTCYLPREHPIHWPPLAAPAEAPRERRAPLAHGSCAAMNGEKAMSEAKARELLGELIAAWDAYFADRDNTAPTWARLDRARDDARAYLAAVPAPPAEPRVPREPTPRMCEAACRLAEMELGLEAWVDQARDLWIAMYDAAPAAEPAAQPEQQQNTAATPTIYSWQSGADSRAGKVAVGSAATHEPVAQQPPPRNERTDYIVRGLETNTCRICGYEWDRGQPEQHRRDCSQRKRPPGPESPPDVSRIHNPVA